MTEDLRLEELSLLVLSDAPLERRRLALTAVVRFDPEQGADLVERLVSTDPSPDDRAVGYHGTCELAESSRAEVWERLLRLAEKHPETADAVAEALSSQRRQAVVPLLRSRLGAPYPAFSRLRSAVLLATRFSDLSGLSALADESVAEGGTGVDVWAAFDAVPPAERNARYAALVTSRFHLEGNVDRLRDLLLLLDAPTRLSGESIMEVSRLLADSRSTDLPALGLRRTLGDLAAFVLARCALAAPWYHQAELLLTAPPESRRRLLEDLRRDVEALRSG